jgi:hypothetical protein
VSVYLKLSSVTVPPSKTVGSRNVGGDGLGSVPPVEVVVPVVFGHAPGL